MGDVVVPERFFIERFGLSSRGLESVLGTALARRLVPHATPEDLRNPHDFAPLLESAEFNFEDGILAGLLSAAAALRLTRRDTAG